MNNIFVKGTRLIHENNGYEFCIYIEEVDKDESIVKYRTGSKNGEEVRVLNKNLHYENKGNAMKLYEKYRK